MKKIYLSLLIVFLFQACTSDMEEILQVGEVETSKVTTRQASDGEYDLLGFSYDITGDYLHVDNAKKMVVDIKSFIGDPNNKDRFYNPATIIANEDFYAGANVEEFLQEIKDKRVTGGSGGLKIGPLSLSGSAKVTKEKNERYSYSNKYSFARVDIIKRIKRLYLDVVDANDLIPYLSTAFINNLNKMTPEQFVEEYGTHVLLDISIGGRLQFNYRSVITETDNNIEKKKIVEAGAKTSIGIFGASGNGSHETTEVKNLNKKNSNWDVQISYHGGTNSGLNYSLTSTEGLTSIQFNKTQWEESVNDKNAALVDINWNKTFPIYEFISDVTKKQQIKKAVENYLEGKKLQTMNLIPMYTLYDMNVYDCLYTTNLKEYISYSTNNVAKNGACFYVHKTQEPNTIPIYRVYDSNGHNHIYLARGGDAELNQYLSWTQYEGIEGYVYSPYQTPPAGTIPIYAFYAEESINCILVMNEKEVPSYSEWCTYNGIAFYAYPQ